MNFLRKLPAFLKKSQQNRTLTLDWKKVYIRIFLQVSEQHLNKFIIIFYLNDSNYFANKVYTNILKVFPYLPFKHFIFV